MIEPVLSKEQTAARAPTLWVYVALAAFASIYPIFALVSMQDKRSHQKGAEEELQFKLTTSEEKRDQQVAEEERTYRMAAGDIDRLKAYVRNCSACNFKAAALDDIDKLEGGQLAQQQEERDYRNGRGSLSGLRAYVNGCTFCAYKSDALSEISGLERADQIHQMSLADLCPQALDPGKTSWDTSSGYIEYVAEARRRGLTVDGCRSELGLNSDESRSSLQQSALQALQEYYRLHSSGSDFSTNRIAELYARKVNWYGKMRASRKIIVEKVKYFEHWPERTFTVRDNGLSFDCDEHKKSCVISGTVDFNFNSPERGSRISGFSSIRIGIANLDKSPKVISEWSKVEHKY